MTTLVVPDTVTPDRCDKILAQLLDVPRSTIKVSFLQEPFQRSGKILTLHDTVYPGDTLTFRLMDPAEQRIKETSLNLDVLFEDESVIVINKPAQISVHPAPGIQEKTLVEYVEEHCPLCKLGEAHRHGVVHRLDKDTTGCIVFAKTNRAFKCLSADFKEHRIDKQYTCIVHGRPSLNTGKIEVPVARSSTDKAKMAVTPKGKAAKTTWVIRERFRDFSWLDVKIYTGRTHQIRVHLNHIGHPIVGDPTYRDPKYIKNIPTLAVPRILLHAEQLTFMHPVTDKLITVRAPIPEDFRPVIEQFRQISSAAEN